MKKTKKLLSLLLSIMLMVTLLPPSTITALADATNANAEISVENVTAVPGSTVEVEVTISNNPGILGAILSLSYDDGLTLTNVTEGDAFSSLSLTKPGKFKSPCQFTWDGMEIDESDIKDGVIMTLSFTVSNNLNAGDKCNISLSCKNGDFVDANLKPISVSFNNANVSIINYTPGDVNGDTRVNTMDVILMRRYIAGGYDVTINNEAADVNADTSVNMIDVILIRRYLAGGYDVKLLPGATTHKHELERVTKKEASCTENGNIAYYHCTSCDNYYTDLSCVNQISIEDTIIASTGHTVVVDEAVPATTTSKGLTEGSHCSVCGTVIVAQQEYGPLVPNTANITYKVAYTETTTSNGTKTIVADNYIASQTVENSNPNTYEIGTGLSELKELSLDGYDFLGWFESPEVGANRVYSISTGDTGDKTLYGIWSAKTYSVTYKMYKTPLADTIDSKYCSYTTSKGLADLPNPTINNYVFIGWYTNDGEEVTEIPAGTSGDIVLNAYWTSKRNLAKANSRLDDPIIVEDTDNGVIYFTYELGTIENIPLSDNIWTIQSVSGLSQQKSESFTTSLTQSKADTISNTISNSTVDSGTWTLSEGWSDTTSVTEEWAEQHGVTVEEANERCLSTSNTFSLTNSNGGSSSTTKTDGTTTLDYKSQNYTHGNGAEFGAEISGKYTNSTEVSASGKAGYGPVSAEVGAKNTSTYEVGGKLSADYNQHQEKNEHTGTDTTTVSSTVGTSASTWNNASTSSSTKTASERSTVSKAISDIISSKKGYGSSYTKNGQNSQTQGFSNTESNSVNSSSALTWSSVETKTVTNTYSTDGKSEGCYRLVIAGRAHVFGIVGYDIASKSFFTYTYSVMDDEQYEFLDYAPDLNFNDCENGVIPFEIPYDVYDYSMAATVRTDGLVFRTDSTSQTATVVRYEGTETDVTVPNYITTGGTAYRVTDINPNAFAGKNIRSIILSKFIKELPNGAFKNCSSLEEISGYYNVIGAEAFSGCTSLESYNIPISIKSIGENAFLGVSSLNVNAIGEEYALKYSDNNESQARELTQNLITSAINSGADNIVLGLANIIDGCELSISVPEISYFKLIGGKNKTFSNIKIQSNANETIFDHLTVNNEKRIPLEISSSKLTLDTVHIDSSSYCLMLSKSTEVSLLRDNVLNSINNKAIVCKNPIFTSETSDGVAGFLEIFGNVYVCGTITGTDNIELKSGEIVYLTEEEFNNYLKGTFTVTFDVNGGNTLSNNQKTVYYGNAFGELPEPKKDYYTFDGWYTNAEGGNKVASDDIFNVTEDIVLYAHWTLNPVSGWVLDSAAPSDSQIISQKWTYDETSYTTSGSSSLSGWTKYDTQWKWSSYGNWSGWINGYISGSDSREVQYRTLECYYHFKGTTKDHIYCPQQHNSNYQWHAIYVLSSEVSAYGVSSCSNAFTKYSGPACPNCGATGYWFRTVNPSIDDIPQYNYRDRSKVYTYYYYKVESKESTTEKTNGGNISNVQKWVQYRNK